MRTATSALAYLIEKITTTNGTPLSTPLGENKTVRSRV